MVPDWNATPIISQGPFKLLTFRKILEECDGVMVARGDLGVEMNPQEMTSLSQFR